MKEAFNPKIDWKSPVNDAVTHAHRYKEQLQHVEHLDPNKATGLTPKEAQRFINYARFSRLSNLNEILGNYSIHIKPKQK